MPNSYRLAGCGLPVPLPQNSREPQHCRDQENDGGEVDEQRPEEGGMRRRSAHGINLFSSDEE